MCESALSHLVCRPVGMARVRRRRRRLRRPPRRPGLGGTVGPQDPLSARPGPGPALAVQRGAAPTAAPHWHCHLRSAGPRHSRSESPRTAARGALRWQRLTLNRCPSHWHRQSSTLSLPYLRSAQGPKPPPYARAHPTGQSHSASVSDTASESRWHSNVWRTLAEGLQRQMFLVCCT